MLPLSVGILPQVNIGVTPNFHFFSLSWSWRRVGGTKGESFSSAAGASEGLGSVNEAQLGLV